MTRGRVQHHATPGRYNHELDPRGTFARGSTRKRRRPPWDGLCDKQQPQQTTNPRKEARMDALIEADGLSKKIREGAGPLRPDPHPAGRRAGGHPRAQRRRQDHLHPHGGDAHRARPRHARRQRARRRARPDGRAPHDRPRRPVRRRRGDDDRPREPRHGGPPVRPGSRRGGGLGPDGSWSRWIWWRPPTARSGPIPAGCDGGSTSGRAWSARPGCCCSTSRRRASTPAAATRCGTPCTP